MKDFKNDQMQQWWAYIHVNNPDPKDLNIKLYTDAKEIYYAYSSQFVKITTGPFFALNPAEAIQIAKRNFTDYFEVEPVYSPNKVSLLDFRKDIKILEHHYDDFTVINNRLCAIGKSGGDYLLNYGLNLQNCEVSYSYASYQDCFKDLLAWSGKGHPEGAWISAKKGDVLITNPMVVEGNHIQKFTRK